MKSLRHLFPFKSYFHFRFRGRHFVVSCGATGPCFCPRLDQIQLLPFFDQTLRAASQHGYPHIFDHARRRYATVDMARRRPTSGTENGGDTNRKWIQPLSDDLAMSSVAYLSRAWSKMWGSPLKSHRHLFPFKSYFYFRFASSPFCVSHVGRRRAMSSVANLSRASSQMWG